MWGRYMWGTNVGRCVELNLACESARRMPIDRWAQAGENYWAGQETPWTQALTSCGTPRHLKKQFTSNLAEYLNTYYIYRTLV
jgi:hypothetical protein